MKIIKCVCNHHYQDSKYGEQQRAMNQTKKASGETYRCTVCSKEHTKK